MLSKPPSALQVHVPSRVAPSTNKKWCPLHHNCWRWHLRICLVWGQNSMRLGHLWFGGKIISNNYYYFCLAEGMNLDGTIPNLFGWWSAVTARERRGRPSQFSGPREGWGRHCPLDFLDRAATENCSGVHLASAWSSFKHHRKCGCSSIYPYTFNQTQPYWIGLHISGPNFNTLDRV